MDVGAAIVQLIHIAGGAAWFGGSLFANAVVIPYVGRQSVERRRELIGGLILGPERVMIAAALTAVVSGLVRGIVFGRIQSVDVFGTPYGIVWLASVVVAILVFATGGRVTSPAARALRDDDGIRGGGSDDTVAARTFGRLRFGFRLELAGISIILGLMVVLARL
jgi:uncharacterized membrane protein